MSIYSKQVIYCNACGFRMETELPQVMGREYRVCSRECLEEMNWRHALSILGEAYRKSKAGP